MIRAGFVVREPGRAAPAPDARWEYRVWSGAMHPAVSHLQRVCALRAAERRCDVYLLGPDPARVLVTLRDGQRLEIKRRLQDLGRVRHWTMPVSTGFPLAPDARAALAEGVDLRDALAPETGLSPAHMLVQLRTDEGRRP